MGLLEPRELLGTSRLLASPQGVVLPTEACLRRAISTAYYAVFHMVLRAASDRFMGAGHEQAPGYVLLYRGFNHKHMKDVCEKIDVSTLNQKYSRDLHRTAFSQEVRDFAAQFSSLQANRHLADYHPTFIFKPSEVSSIVDGAEVAMDAFDRVAADEKADLLALLLVGIRS